MSDQQLLRLRLEFLLTLKFHVTHILIATYGLECIKHFASYLFSISLMPGIVVGAGDIKINKKMLPPFQHHYETGVIISTLHLRNLKLLRFSIFARIRQSLQKLEFKFRSYSKVHLFYYSILYSVLPTVPLLKSNIHFCLFFPLDFQMLGFERNGTIQEKDRNQKTCKTFSI